MPQDHDDKTGFPVKKISAWAGLVLTLLSILGGLYTAGRVIWRLESNVEYLVAKEAERRQVEASMEEQMKGLQLAQKSLQLQLQDAITTLANVVATQSENVKKIEALQRSPDHNTAPALEFAAFGHKIEDGAPGEHVKICWAYRKLRDCGAPKLDLWLRNGGNRLHRFRQISVRDADGRGISARVDPQRAQDICYSAQIPPDEGIEAGGATGWVALTYPDCPAAPAAISPEVPFTIKEHRP